MQKILSEILKSEREKNGISVAEAASRAEVSVRTWEGYESAKESLAHRGIPKRALRLFFNRSLLPIPVPIRKLVLSHDTARVLCFTVNKGGGGKTSITIDVGACLASQGERVAIISSDIIYRVVKNQCRLPRPDTWVSQIRFFDYSHVAFSKAESKILQQSAKNHPGIDRPSAYSSSRRNGHRIICTDPSDPLKVVNFADLKKDFDYILLDINGEREVIRNHADFIAILLNCECMVSVNNATGLVESLRSVSSNRRFPKIFGLMTRYDVASRSSAETEYLAGMQLSYEDWDEINQGRRSAIRRYERVLGLIRSFPLPRLSSTLTSAFEHVEEAFNEEHGPENSFHFYDSVIDASPDSIAADEIIRLTNEIAQARL